MENQTTACSTGIFQGTDLKILENSVVRKGDSFYADYHSMQLGSYFYRVFSTTHQRGVGYEVFFRGMDGDGVTHPATTIFGGIKDPQDAIQMDRMRMVLHCKNFMAAQIEDRWMITNMHPRSMLGVKDPDVAFLVDLLAYTRFPAHQLVVALREHAGNFETVLTRTMKQLKEVGCLVLFDDFRADSANLDRFWRLSPDIVKLDHSLIDNALQSGRAKRMLFKLVSLIQASGCLVLMDKIASEEEAFLVMRLEVDLVNGPYFGKLESKAIRLGVVDMDGAFRNLSGQSDQKVFKEFYHHNLEMIQYSSEFMECAWAIADDILLEEAAAKLIKLPGVERVYLLDYKGYQVSQNLVSESKKLRMDLRYKPLWDAYGATWTRRSSFFDAIRNPGVVQYSPPYRSTTSLHMCMTLSISIRKGEHAYVLCCDVEWKEDKIF
ncbi:MAG: EAL domain-containing protein [Magnetococcus sp. YQC-5]